MKLSEMLKEIKCERIIGNTDIEISGIATNAESVCEGDLFVCYKGLNHDSHDYVQKAIKNGAAAIVCERSV